MTFPFGILLFLIGCCLIWVGVRGVETATPTGIFEALMDGMSGTKTRTESATNPTDGEDGAASAERPNIGSEGEW